jgi:hypothetical protein
VADAVTAVHCGRCGKRTATAHRGDEDGYDLGHDDVVIQGRYDPYSHSPWREALPDDRRPTWGGEVITGALSETDWPLTWTCQHCAATVHLNRDQGRRVGHDKRLIAAKLLDHK